MKLKDVVFVIPHRREDKTLVACRIFKTTRAYIAEKNINLALLVETAVEEIKKKEASK